MPTTVSRKHALENKVVRAAIAAERAWHGQLSGAREEAEGELKMAVQAYNAFLIEEALVIDTDEPARS